jgi:anthranilate phosphoribosyltransferase
MRELSIKVPLGDVPYLVDTCGTGGDGAHTFNISTAAVFVAAACGAHVAKHGGRSVSSTSGSADVLEALGANVSLPPEKLVEAVRTIGVGFMFAPNHHSAMKHAAPVRRELGVRTLFNMLGPLTNPAGAPNQVLGVYSRELTGKLARVLQALGSRHVLVVHAEEGLDEISLASPTWVAELKDGHVSEYELEPGLFGLPQVPASELVVNGRDEAAAMLLAALENRDAAASAIVALNAGAAVYTSGRAGSLQQGVALAQAAIQNGAARARLDDYIRLSKQD